MKQNRIEKLEEKLACESNKQTEIQLILKKLNKQIEIMRHNVSNAKETAKPLSEKKRTCCESLVSRNF
ncbi:unnamed protein product [Heterobilharzia americana]|nr:unnamed protein product [Heterobilharzia americana]